MQWVRTRKGIMLSSVMAVAVLLVSMYFALQKPVTIQVDGQEIQTRVFFTGTVEELLDKEEINVGQYDLVQPALNHSIEKDMKIIIERAFKVTVLADEQKKEVLTIPVSVEAAISRAGITLGEKDIIKTQVGENVQPGQEIEIIRVTEEEVTEEVQLAFAIERVDDPTLEKGLSRTVQAGHCGVGLNTIKITYYNGQEEKREIINSEQQSAPINKILAMGNITEVSRGGERFDFREARMMSATAYTYTGNRTATGKHPAVGMVAVDPRVILLGSRLYVEGYGFAVAADTGGAVKGNSIDLFMEERAQCLKWGRRNTKVYVLN